jgi:hypothetical protein
VKVGRWASAAFGIIVNPTVSTDAGKNLLRVQDDTQQQAFLLPWFYFFSGGNWAAYPTARLCGGSAAPPCLHHLMLLACVCFHAAFGFSLPHLAAQISGRSV